ncbi:MAG: alanine racemase [bacterium]
MQRNGIGMADHPTRAVIDLSALHHNLQVIRERIGPQRRILAVVKANAYGHGAGVLCAHLEGFGVDMLGVAYPEEGLNLRDAGITSPILVMSGTLPDQLEGALEANLTISLSDLDTAKALSQLALRNKRRAKVHVKVDTGMGRLGFPLDDAINAVTAIASLPHLSIEGIFTHLATSEDADHSYTRYQTERFTGLVRSLEGLVNPPPIIHMGNSAAVMKHPETYFDMVRVGIMLYGLAPVPGLQKALPIRPIMSLQTKIIHIKRMPEGSSLSYGRTYICPSDKVIAVIPVGYSDGLARCMSTKIHVLLRGVRVPVVGTVCMDMSLVDITGIDGVEIGEEVVLIGSQGGECITAHDWAAWQNTIPYEVLCAVGPRVKRIYRREEGTREVVHGCKANSEGAGVTTNGSICTG